MALKNILTGGDLHHPVAIRQWMRTYLMSRDPVERSVDWQHRVKIHFYSRTFIFLPILPLHLPLPLPTPYLRLQ